jgi:hypothetical protein
LSSSVKGGKLLPIPPMAERSNVTKSSIAIFDLAVENEGERRKEYNRCNP